MDDQLRIADRVFQLESSILDKEFYKIVDSSVESLDIPTVSHELKLLLKLYVLFNQLKQKTTIGMNIFKLKLCEDGGNQHALVDPRRFKLVFLATSNLVLPYFLGKTRVLHYLEGVLRKKLAIPFLTVDNAVLVGELVNLTNSMLFLRHGVYTSISERLIGIVKGISDEDASHGKLVNRAQMEYLNRDTIWRALAEILVMIIPHINLAKVKNQFRKVLGPFSSTYTNKTLSSTISDGSNHKTCAICKQQPFNPYVIGCSHIFCYYCLQSKYLSDPGSGYVCPSCNFQTNELKNIRRNELYKHISLD